MKSLITLFIGFAALGIIAGCDSSGDDNFKRKNAVAGEGPDGGVVDPAAPKCVDFGAKYTGFAQTDLNDKRVNAAIGADRARIKPYSALKGEYNRVIGATPDSLDKAGASFGSPPDRFSAEPKASAIQIYSAFHVAFDGCLTFTQTAPEFAAAPAPDTASTQCTNMARKFWSRSATKDEVDACAQVALTDSATETDPRRRWAYTCASLLTSAGFLTY